MTDEDAARQASRVQTGGDAKMSATLYVLTLRPGSKTRDPQSFSFGGRDVHSRLPIVHDDRVAAFAQ